MSGPSSPVRITDVRVEGFRSIRDARFRPRSLAALIGESGTGKSNLLNAIRAVLDPEAAGLTPEDLTRDYEGPTRVIAHMSDGSTRIIDTERSEPTTTPDGSPPPVLFLPARLRTGPVVAPFSNGGEEAARAAEILGQEIAPGEVPEGRATTRSAHGLVGGLEASLAAGVGGLIFLIEEPELFLPPQTQRYLYRLLRRLAGGGNQIMYSTHSPSFLNVARLQELVLTEHVPATGTKLLQPEALPEDEEFRAYSEFDAARGELFLAKAAVLVEGLTEKLALPFAFHALGHDPDRERISIIECGGKSNIPLVARIARAVGVPFVAVHDRDAPSGSRPNQAERRLNRTIVELAGDENRVQLIPDFEGATGLRGHHHKPARAWHSLADLVDEEVPPPLRRIVERAVALARG